MGRFKFVILLFLPLFGFAQDYPRFELYQLVQGQDSGQFVTTGVDSNLDFNSVLRFRFQDSTLLIGADTVITDADIVPILLATIDAGLGIEVNQVNGQIFIESLSIEDSIYNGSGSIIPKGTPLYASDTQGNYWDVAPARADDPSKMPVVVIAGEEIGIGEVGLGLIKGHIKQVNTTGLADGSEVYVGATGGYTSTKPTDEGVIIQRLGTVIKGETTNGSGIINLGDEGFWNDYTSLTKLRDTLVLVRGSITTEIADSLTNYASRTELADTASAIRADFPTGTSLWQEGTTPGEIYYNSGNVAIGNTDPNYPLHVTGDGYFTDDLLVFDRFYIGSDFNHISGSYSPYIDRYSASGETGMDFYAYMSNSSFPLYRFIDSYDSYSTVFQLNPAASTYQAIVNGATDLNGNLTQSGTIVQDGGTVTFNNTQGNYDFGVYSDNCCTTTPFMWIDASADKVQIGSGNPQYTLDVTGDINFTGDLYQNDALVTFGGTAIGDNTDNYILTATGVSDSIYADSGLIWNGFGLTLKGGIGIDEPSLYGGGITVRNSSTGYTSSDGVSMFLDANDFFIDLEEDADLILRTGSGVQNYSIVLQDGGTVKINDLAGINDVGADANGVLQAASSDTTLKTNIISNQYGLQEVINLETIKFNWKDTQKQGNQNEVGFNAQNLQEFIPEATYTIPSTGKLGIKDDAIIATLTKAIQEQQIIIESQDKRIHQLEEMVKQLIEKK